MRPQKRWKKNGLKKFLVVVNGAIQACSERLQQGHPEAVSSAALLRHLQACFFHMELHRIESSATMPQRRFLLIDSVRGVKEVCRSDRPNLRGRHCELESEILYHDKGAPGA